MTLPRARGLIAIAVGVLAIVAIGLFPVTLPATDNIRVPDGTMRRLLGSPTPATNLDEPQPLGTTSPLYAGVTVRQQFVATGREIRVIALLFGTYRRANRGTVEVTLDADAQGQWQPLATRAIEKETLQDNTFVTLTFSPPLVVAKGQTLQITVRSEGSPRDAVSLGKNAAYRPEGYLLTVNDQREDGTLRFQVGYAPRSGRLFRMIGPLWERFTVFLTPLWRIVLLLGFGVLLASFLAIARVLTE